jgi:hypothetical protein
MNEDAMELFHKERWKKHVKGVNEYRGGNVHAPFEGDLMIEYLDEQLDSVNYLEEMYNKGQISFAEFEYASSKHFELWNWRRTRG